MKRAAIYARYSSDKQSESSAEDQARMCRERAAREGWQVVAVFMDAAVSGATRDRPELNRLLARAAEFDLVLAESIDRLSRDQEDIAAIHKRLRFAGVEIVTLADGEVGELHIGLKGTMAALFLRDLAQKTRRGQIGRVEAGRVPGGLSYGYEKVIALDSRGEPERGLRKVVETEAEVVRRIFRLYLADVSPREIAKQLNAAGIRPPRGDLWRASTITGHRQRRNGILYNALYAGRIVYNRQTFLRDPETRKRVARPNPPSEWKSQDVPALRIVDTATWSAVQARLERNVGQPARRQRRPRRLFSGLLRCGECGGTITIMSGEQWGCANHKETGTCANNRYTRNSVVEKRVLAGLNERLLDPRLVSEYVAVFHATAKAELAARKAGKSELARRLRAVDIKVNNLARAIAAGADVSAIRDMLVDASIERDALRAEIADIEADAKILEMSPRLADYYRERVGDLIAALEGPEEDRAFAKASLRGLVEKVVVWPRQDRPGVDLELHGRLAQIIRFAGRNKKAPTEVAGAEKCTALVVAGARSRLSRALSVVIV